MGHTEQAPAVNIAPLFYREVADDVVKLISVNLQFPLNLSLGSCIPALLRRPVAPAEAFAVPLNQARTIAGDCTAPAWQGASRTRHGRCKRLMQHRAVPGHTFDPGLAKPQLEEEPFLLRAATGMGRTVTSQDWLRTPM